VSLSEVSETDHGLSRADVVCSGVGGKAESFVLLG
jgi:hypothetical protein